MKTIKSLLLIIAVMLMPLMTQAKEISFDAGGVFNKQYIGTLEFFSVPTDKVGVSLALNLGIFPLKDYDADISGGLDIKFYFSEEASVSQKDLWEVDYAEKTPDYIVSEKISLVSTRITGTLGVMTSCDYNNTTEFYYGMWIKVGIGYKVIFKEFDWFGNYAFVEPGLDVYIGTSDIIPALSNVPTGGFPRLKCQLGVGI